MHRPVVFTVDDGYLRPLCVTLRSLASANPKLPVIVLHTELSEASAERLYAEAAEFGLDLELRRAELDVKGPLWGWISPAAYLRLAIPQVLSDFDSVLYLDSDLLVLGDVTPLLEADLGGAPVAAVPDPFNPVVRCGIGLFGWRELGLDGARQYFNSGVMVFDLAACERKDVFGRALWLLEKHPQHVLFPDQDALNWAADDDWVRLERRWNTFPVSAISSRFPLPCQHEMVPLEVLVAEESSATILHYAGPLKPWKDDFPDGPLRERYRAVLREVDAGVRS
jgi:lipopolysaccharide biosynthesis glycosyltransferase